jgi:hypothetical protein
VLVLTLQRKTLTSPNSHSAHIGSQLFVCTKAWSSFNRLDTSRTAWALSYSSSDGFDDLFWGLPYVASNTSDSGPSSCRLLVTESRQAGGFPAMTNLQWLRWSRGSFDCLPAWIESLHDLHVIRSWLSGKTLDRDFTFTGDEIMTYMPARGPWFDTRKPHLV